VSQIEIKGALAKLLATENLIVQHDHTAQTASFNTATRVLTLPILKDIDQHVYDLFIGHEVGHALWTPTDWRDQVETTVPFDFVNVVEDVRIERLIQSKFPGLRTDFSRGYRTLNDKDFFDISDKDLSKLNFIDRINLHFKLGALAVIPFSDEEMVYVRAVDEADTFDKVCLVSKMLSEFINRKREDEAQESDAPSSQGVIGDKTDNESDTTESRQSDDEQQEGEETQDVETPSAGKDGGEETSETQRAFDENMEKQTDVNNRDRTCYIETPSGELDVYPLEFVRDEFREAIANATSGLERVRNEYSQFLASIKRDVTFMVQQFEMRKSADAYARTQTHKTGVLDTQALFNYRLSDDIFLRQQVTPEGKNHGLVMLVDWSGSMSDHIVQTVKQLIVMVQFCRKVNIPFDVYTFTCQGYAPDYYKELIPNEVSLDFNMSVVHVLSSSAKRREVDEDLFHLYSQAKKISYTFSPCVWIGKLAMGGTPLNNVLFGVPKLIERFKQRTGAQKVSFVCLTDGESSPLHYNVMTAGNVRISMTNGYDTVFLRDGRNTYQLDAYRETPSIIHWLNRKMPDVTITNIFLAGPKGFASYYRHLTGVTLMDNDTYRKSGAQSFTMKNGWPLVCVVNPNTFRDPQQELQCDDGASKAQVRSALKKFLKTKSVSKLILTQLVEQFA
jgi:hypothetical protein